jgi:hypothetical protein
LTKKEQTLGIHHPDMIANVGKLADVFVKLEQKQKGPGAPSSGADESPEDICAGASPDTRSHQQCMRDAAYAETVRVDSVFHQYLDGVKRYW